MAQRLLARRLIPGVGILDFIRLPDSHSPPARTAARRFDVAKLDDAERWSLSLEIVLLTVTLIWLGGTARALVTGVYGMLFWVGVVGLGLLLPLLLTRVRASSGSLERRAMLRAACILLGGLTLRFVFVMAPQWPLVKPWHL